MPSDLGFRCYIDHAGVAVKERANGVRGRCIGDEWSLWQALEAAQAEAEDLRRQVEGHCARIAAQSEILSRNAEAKPEPKRKEHK